MIAILVVAGVFILASAAIAYGVYRAATSEEGKKILAVGGEAVRIGIEAQSAPGTDEVRALGCEQAMAFDIDKLDKMMALLDAGAPPKGVFSTMVMCQVGVFGTAPSCDDVARVYRPAVHPKKPFMASVQHKADHKAKCTAVYDVDGRKLSDVDAGAGPAVP